MPDPSPPKRRDQLRLADANHSKAPPPHHNGRRRGSRARGGLQYAELHCRTNFSFLEGASHPDELVCRSKELEHRALAITDRNSLAGVVQAHVAAKELGHKLLIGAEITPSDAPAVVLLATDRRAYGRLSLLITRGRRRAPKGECLLTFADIAEHADGLLACVISSSERPAWMDERPTDGGHASNSSLASDGESGNGKPRVKGRSKRASSVRKTKKTLTRPSATLSQGARGKTIASDIEGEAEAISAPHSLSGSPSSGSPLHSLSLWERAGVRASSACSHGKDILHAYRDIFADRCYLLAELHRGPADRRQLQHLVELSREARLPLVASNGVYYHTRERRALQDVLTAVRHGCTVAELGERMFSNAERHLKSAEEMLELFAEHPEMLTRSVEVADQCTFSLDELRYDYPEELCPEGQTPTEFLKHLTWKGARERYPGGIPEKVRTLIEHELVLIQELSYEAYFLTVWDLVRFARGRNILCQGRGSAANSAVCFCLGVTSVDPDRIDVLFERFVSKERNEAPDIDVDFEHERREEVIQYVYEKYGRERAGMTAEVITYRPRSAVRDVGKALGLSLDRVDLLAKSLENYGEDDTLARRFREAGLNPTSTTGRQLIVLVRQILGFPRHLSQHVGGMVMTHGPLCELVPLENAAMADRTVIQWDKDDLDSLGILKVDCLALGMLTAIRKSFDFIEQHYARPLTLATVPSEDPAVYGMIQKADTMGVFQIESRAQMSMLPRLRPECFYDLVIEVAIVRPGPIQGDMVHPYLRRRNKEEPVEYPDERVKAVLHKTLGVPIFQEQAMKLAIVAAGFTPGEADQLRRAMGAWRRTGVIDQFRQKLLEGMLVNGYPTEFAERLFNQIRGFGEYGFPESHAASFALLVYVSAWLKHYYPDAFTAALLNSQPMGFYAPAQLIATAKKAGVPVRAVDVNFSDWDCTLEDEAEDEAEAEAEAEAETKMKRKANAKTLTPALSQGERELGVSQGEIGCSRGGKDSEGRTALRMGLRMIRGFSEKHAEVIVRCRHERAFTTLHDFARRTGLGNAVLARLSRADAFASLGLNRRDALWQSLPEQKQLPLFDEVEPEEMTVSLPIMMPEEEVVADYRAVGLSLRAHPMTFLRPLLKQLRAAPASDLAILPHGRRVKVAGVVLLRQRPSTAKGITFVTLEDETGMANLIIRPEIWERYHKVARRAQAMLVHGTLQRQHEVIHVQATKLEDLSSRLMDANMRSRDFR